MLHTFFQSYPVFANCCAAAGLFAAGDVVAQVITQEKIYNGSRTARAAIYGGFIFGPVAAGVGFPFVNGLAAGRPLWQQGLVRTAVDQGIFAPFVYIPMYFTAMPLLEGKSWAKAKENLRENWLQVVETNAAVWVPVQLINFTLIPPAMRLVIVNCVGVGWNSFLALKNSASR